MNPLPMDSQATLTSSVPPDCKVYTTLTAVQKEQEWEENSRRKVAMRETEEERERCIGFMEQYDIAPSPEPMIDDRNIVNLEQL